MPEIVMRTPIIQSSLIVFPGGNAAAGVSDEFDGPLICFHGGSE
jgi:hypothetical protein